MVHRFFACGLASLTAWLSSCLITTAAQGQLGRALFVTVTQSNDASSTNGAALALDGLNATASLTTDSPGSYWSADLLRPFLIQRLELVNRPAPADTERTGLTLKLLDIDDQIVHQTILTNPG